MTNSIFPTIIREKNVLELTFNVVLMEDIDRLQAYMVPRLVGLQM